MTSAELDDPVTFSSRRRGTAGSPAKRGSRDCDACGRGLPSSSPVWWDAAQQSRVPYHEGAEQFWISRTALQFSRHWTQPGRARSTATAKSRTFEPRSTGWTRSFTCRWSLPDFLSAQQLDCEPPLSGCAREGADWRGHARDSRGRRHGRCRAFTPLISCATARSRNCLSAGRAIRLVRGQSWRLWSPRCRSRRSWSLIEGADHFFEGRLRELRETIESWVNEAFSHQPSAIN